MRTLTTTIRIAFFFTFASVLGLNVNAQSLSMADREAFIQKYATVATREMFRSNMPASIKLAQLIHESQWGKSELTANANNGFGMKATAKWAGKVYEKKDDEKGLSKFRQYESLEASIIDHTNHIKNSARYAELHKISRTDYKAWAQGLQKCGYATNPQYAQFLVSIIEQYKLDRFDAAKEFVVENGGALDTNAGDDDVKETVPSLPMMDAKGGAAKSDDGGLGELERAILQNGGKVSISGGDKK
jgi:hypothetical protein